MNITEAPYRISGKIEKKEMGKKMDPFIAFRQVFRLSGYLMLATMMQLAVGCRAADAPRERISISDGWRFMKYGPDDKVDELIYDVRPEVRRRREIILGEDAATAAVDVKAEKPVLKSWVMPTGNGDDTHIDSSLLQCSQECNILDSQAV